MSTKQQTKAKVRHDTGLFDQGAGQKLVLADHWDPDKFKGTPEQKKKEEDKSRLLVAQRASLDADCIVTAMILGLCRERVGRKQEIILTAEHQNSGDLEKLREATQLINRALATTGLKHLPPVKAGYAPKFQETREAPTQTSSHGKSSASVREKPQKAGPPNYITGKHHGAGLAQSMLKDFVKLEGVVFEQFFSEQPHKDLYTGRGAYTGVHMHQGKTLFWGSTFRHNIPDTCERWIPKKEALRIRNKTTHQVLEPWGLIGCVHQLPNMRDASEGKLTPEQQNKVVVGYTHGMIQAIYSAAYHGFKGTTIEVAVGVDTKKMASCFACTTFMCATDYPPDAIHLGRGESWAPVFPKSDSITLLAERLKENLKAPPNQERLEAAVQYMNQKWHAKCASWLYWGSRIDLDCVEPGHQAAWRRVQKFAEEHRHHEEKVANLFLDALTVHCGDTERVNATLTAPPRPL